MKKALKITLGVIAGFILFVGIALAYVKWYLPDVGPAPQLTIHPTAAQIEHGKYLAHHVAVCVDCHSTRDFTRFSGPLVAGTEGRGGEQFTREMGFPGTFYARNLTPASLGTWTDGEIFRAITAGVSRDGSALFPVMPYQNYAKMDPGDIRDIIAYLRTLKPISNKIPSDDPDFPMNFILNTIPAKTNAGKRPAPADQVAYGRYLTMFASCGDCHTQMDNQGQSLPGMDMAGGRTFPIPTGLVRSMNITPARSGIGAWTKENFIARFKAYAGDNKVLPGVHKEGFNSIMPWTRYADMREQDLGAIYDYLRTMTPVENSVERFTPVYRKVAGR